MIETDEQLHAVVEEFFEQGIPLCTDDKGIIKKGSMFIHMNKDKSPIFTHEQAAIDAAIYATTHLRTLGYDGEPIYSQSLNGFGVRVGDKLDA